MRRALAVLALAAASPAFAQDEPRFCPNRPDLADTGCTVDPGRVLLEVSAFDWQRSGGGGTREDEMVAGDLLARIGIADHAEVQVGWTAFGRVRTRDAAGRVRVRSGVGDVRLGLRRNLMNPDGGDLSIAVEPFVVLPTGGDAIGAGDWSAGLAVPINQALDDRWTLNVTAQVAAAADEDGAGRHLSAFGVAGLTYAVTSAISASGEVLVDREEERGNRRTETLAAASVAWQPRDRLQLDLLAVAGLSRAAPDLRLVAGGAILF
jgi:hypothetical protein